MVLMWDEMRIREDLVVDKNYCQLIGFTNLGEINQFCLSKNNNNSTASSSEVASHTLLLMVRGMFSGLQFPYIHFPLSQVVLIHYFH